MLCYPWKFLHAFVLKKCADIWLMVSLWLHPFERKTCLATWPKTDRMRKTERLSLSDLNNRIACATDFDRTRINTLTVRRKRIRNIHIDIWHRLKSRRYLQNVLPGLTLVCCGKSAQSPSSFESRGSLEAQTKTSTWSSSLSQSTTTCSS